MAQMQDLTLLRRKLSLLSYTEHLDNSSAPLVQRLVDDLIHTTESYRNLKTQLDARGQDLSEYHAQLDVVAKDNNRLRAEAAKVHHRLLQSKEQREADALHHESEAKELQQRTQSLSASNKLSASRFAALERDHEALQAQLKGLLAANDPDGVQSALEFSSSYSVVPTCDQQQAQTVGEINVLTAAQNRIESLEAELQLLRQENQDARAELERLQGAIAGRDAELERHIKAMHAGPEADQSAMQLRNEVNESIILQLTEQVEGYQAKFAHLEGELKRSKRMREEAAEAKASKQKAELKLEEMSHTTEELRNQVAALKTTILSLQMERCAKSSHSGADADACLAKVIEFKQDLQSTAQGQAALRRVIHKAHRDQAASVMREKSLQAEVRALKVQLADLKAAKDQLLTKYTAKENRASAKRPVKHSGVQAGDDSSELSELQARLEEQAQELARTRQELQDSRRQTGLKSAPAVNPSREATADDPCNEQEQQVMVLQAQLLEYGSKLHASQAECSSYRGEMHPLKEKVEQCYRDLTTLRRSLEVAELHRGHIQEQLAAMTARCQQATHTLERLCAGWPDALNGAKQKEALEDLHHLQALLTVAGTEVAPLTAGNGQKILALQRQLVVKEEELHGEKAQAQANKAAYEGAQCREQESNALARQQGERARRAEQLAEQLRAELDTQRIEMEADRSRARSMSADLESARRDADQLRSLTLQGDSTVQNLLARLKAVTSGANASEERVTGLTEALQQREQALTQQQEALNNMQQALEKLSEERNTAANEAQAALQRVSDLSGELQMRQRQADELGRYVADLEGQVVHGSDQQQARAAELAELQVRLKASEAECSELHEELGAVSDDMAMLVRENQHVSGQLLSLAQERNALECKVRDSQAQASQLQQLQLSCSGSAAALQRANEELQEEQAGLQSRIARLEEQAAQLKGRAESSTRDAIDAQEAATAAQQQMARLTAKLQAAQQAVDRLEGRLQQSHVDGGQLDKDRRSMLEKLSAAELVRCENERQREGLQRQLAALTSQLQMSEKQRREAAAEIQALQRKLSLEGERISELELLIQHLRAAQFHGQGPSPQKGQPAHPEAVLDKSSDLEAQARDKSLLELRAQLAEAREENEQVMDMLARLDQDRAALKQVNQQLHAQLDRLSRPANGNQGPQDCYTGLQSPTLAPKPYTPGQSAAIDELHRLKAELEREKLHRCQAEQDFEELLGTIDELRG